MTESRMIGSGYDKHCKDLFSGHGSVESFLHGQCLLDVIKKEADKALREILRDMIASYIMSNSDIKKSLEMVARIAASGATTCLQSKAACFAAHYESKHAMAELFAKMASGRK